MTYIVSGGALNSTLLLFLTPGCKQDRHFVQQTGWKTLPALDPGVVLVHQLSVKVQNPLESGPNTPGLNGQRPVLENPVTALLKPTILT